MNKHDAEKRKLPQQDDQAQNAQETEREPSEHQERRPSSIEPREWRGAGVCGDRHTD